MRKALLLAPLVMLALTGCIPQPPTTLDTAPSITQPASPPSASDDPQSPTSPDDGADDGTDEGGLDALAASVADAEGVTSVEAGDDGFGLTVRISVEDDIARGPLQALVESLYAEADALSLDLEDCLCTVETTDAYGVLVWFGGMQPGDLAPIFDAWEWVAGFSSGERPEIWLSEYSWVNGVTEYDNSEAIVEFITGVTEDGVATDTLGDEVYELTLSTWDGYDSCSRISATEPIAPETAELLTSIFSDGIGGVEDVCLTASFDSYGLYIGSVHELGQEQDAQLLADVVTAFEELDADVYY